MRAGHRERVVAPDELLFYSSGGRSVAKLPDEDLLELWIPARHDIADDYDIRTRLEILGAVALAIRNPHLLQPRRHRRINVLVRPGYRVTRRFQKTGERGHRRATDADEVIVNSILAATAHA